MGIQSPLAMRFHCCLVSAALSGLTMAKLEDHPLPWNIVFNVDGISQSDTLAMHDRRSLQAMYWAVEEFGQEHLGRDELWFEVATLRGGTMVKYVDGGLSHVVNLLLRQSFFGPGEKLRGRYALVVPWSSGSDNHRRRAPELYYM